MLIEIWERLRGYDKWIQTQAKIESSDISKVNVVTENGKVANTHRYAGDRLTWIDARGNKQHSTFTVDEKARSTSTSTVNPFPSGTIPPTPTTSITATSRVIGSRSALPSPYS